MARLTLEQYLSYIIDGDYDSAREPIPAMMPAEYRFLERKMRDKAGRPRVFPDPRQFAVALEVDVCCDENVRGCYGEVNEGNTILYRWDSDQRVRGLRIYHGLAHWILREWWGFDSEVDAWLLTCELAFPRTFLLNAGPELAAIMNRWAPVWMAERYACRIVWAA